MERRIDEQLEELELVSWNDKLEMETARCSQLETEAEALRSGTARCEMEVEEWQQRLEHITATTESVKTNSQQMHGDETRLKEQVHISSSCCMFKMTSRLVIIITTKQQLSEYFLLGKNSARAIGADLPGAVGADAPIDGRLMGAVHP